jgi:hypothetical protein
MQMILGGLLGVEAAIGPGNALCPAALVFSTFVLVAV